jgi:steroid 5-alpha reductase family enzyme
MDVLARLFTGISASAVPQAFMLSLWIFVLTAAGVFLAGFLTVNYSHVDRLWSLLPPVYALVWALEFYREPLYLIPAVLVILWGARLTYNFARRGGYHFEHKKGFTGEDYRWPILRKKIGNRFLFELFNLFFITGFQLTLIFLFTLPLFFIGTAAQSGAALTPAHILLALLFAACLYGELTADNQQYRFQENKVPGKGPGFNTKGLWRYSRHPNYVCELSQWIILAVYAGISGVDPLRAGVGAAVLVVLFVGSTAMTESITRSKYPEYAEWQKITSPWIPGIKTLILRGRREERRNFADLR